MKYSWLLELAVAPLPAIAVFVASAPVFILLSGGNPLEEDNTPILVLVGTAIVFSARWQRVRWSRWSILTALALAAVLGATALRSGTPREVSWGAAQGGLFAGLALLSPVRFLQRLPQLTAAHRSLLMVGVSGVAVVWAVAASGAALTVCRLSWAAGALPLASVLRQLGGLMFLGFLLGVAPGILLVPSLRRRAGASSESASPPVAAVRDYLLAGASAALPCSIWFGMLILYWHLVD